MVDVAETAAGVEVWIDFDAVWVRLAQAETRIGALVEAEHLLRDHLGDVQELLTEARQTERAQRGGG